MICLLLFHYRAIMKPAVTLARALRGLHIPRIGIAKVGNTLLSNVLW